MSLHPSTRTFLSPLLKRSSIQPPVLTSRQPFSTSSVSQAKKGEDINEINTSKTEYTRSGTDDQAARQKEAAFSPDTTSPGEERELAGKGTGQHGNPLDVSPANRDVSKTRVPDEGGPERSPREGSKDKKSGFGKPEKKGKADHGA
ncbi:uncharacterized protein BP5553_04601 [Venustampulla echinocandica]|uniref:Uncharacterized protein n=1 Tax=Venustampulla echinocandica TaxID=2656787 RepID=A0A370TNT2_9HELO|nr:uncharacterized protein BP5553_04601 [Venustampulla echinocandica]RDL37168.1 hypothetical protein BP5553_04601 [Venustampulla echinocandica]